MKSGFHYFSQREKDYELNRINPIPYLKSRRNPTCNLSHHSRSLAWYHNWLSVPLVRILERVTGFRIQVLSLWRWSYFSTSYDAVLFPEVWFLNLQVILWLSESEVSVCENGFTLYWTNWLTVSWCRPLRLESSSRSWEAQSRTNILRPTLKLCQLINIFNRGM